MDDYWNQYWNYSDIINRENKHAQVGRTIQGIPLEGWLWDKTIEFVFNHLDLELSMSALDLCAGNGLITEPLSQKVKFVIAVDCSKKFIDSINKKQLENTTAICCDARSFKFKDNFFDISICYFALQHFKVHESIELFRNIYHLMKPGGKFYIGDIPDLDRIWEFHSTDNYKSVFFESLERREPIIGTWYKKDTLINLSKYIGYSKQEIITQEKFMINNHYRFDMLLIK